MTLGVAARKINRPWLPLELPTLLFIFTLGCFKAGGQRVSHHILKINDKLTCKGRDGKSELTVIWVD